jgi:hypothetical protein
MKKLLEVLVCFLHPLAVVLAWINLAGRSDLTGFQKLAWAARRGAAPTLRTTLPRELPPAPAPA